MFNVCSARCGHCGRCDNDPRVDEAVVAERGCDICGNSVRLTIAGVGSFCGQSCASRRTPELCAPSLPQPDSFDQIRRS